MASRRKSRMETPSYNAVHVVVRQAIKDSDDACRCRDGALKGDDHARVKVVAVLVAANNLEDAEKRGGTGSCPAPG
jgi:hypothetical protein